MTEKTSDLKNEHYIGIITACVSLVIVFISPLVGNLLLIYCGYYTGYKLWQGYHEETQEEPEHASEDAEND